MKPYNQRTPDHQYHDLLQKIMTEGIDVDVIHGEKARFILGHQMKFDLKNGFPMMTERDLSGRFMTGAIAEHIGFLHGARTHEELSKWGCTWWKRWVTKEKCAIFGLDEGDLGPGSYGMAWTSFPTSEGTPFNQIKEVIKQIKERPYLRTHIISNWIPQYTIQHADKTRKVVVAPCHGFLHILVYPETKEISVHHFQRSGDIPVGVVFNIIQYASFLMMLGQILDYTPKELVYTVSDAHIYHSQFEKVQEILSREPKRFPTMTINNTEIKDILDFRPDNFILTDYEAYPAMIIPTPI